MRKLNAYMCRVTQSNILLIFCVSKLIRAIIKLRVKRDIEVQDCLA